MNKLILALVIIQAITGSCGSQRERADFAPVPGSPFAVGKQPRGLALVDVNNDRKLDVVTANEGGDDITVLLGDGRGRFKQAVGATFAVRAPISFAAMGDLNKDGNIDLALAQHEGSYEVIILLGDGEARFKPAPSSPFTALKSTTAHDHGLVLVDVNGDGNLELVTGNGGSNAGLPDESMSVSLGDGKGGFEPAVGSPFRIGRLPAAFVVADVNRDRKPDIVISVEAGKDLCILLGDGRDGFSAAAISPMPLVKYASGVVVDDLNNDGNPDIVLGHDDSGLLSVLLGEGAARFKPAEGYPIDLGDRAWVKFAGDMNRDGKVDLIIRNANDSLTILFGDGRLGFKNTRSSTFPVGKDPFNLAVDDLNGDGKLDILTANYGSDNVTVLLGQ